MSDAGHRREGTGGVPDQRGDSREAAQHQAEQIVRRRPLLPVLQLPRRGLSNGRRLRAVRSLSIDSVTSYRCHIVAKTI